MRNIDNDSQIFIMFLLLAAAIVAYAVYVALRKPNRRVPTLPVNRKNIRNVGYLRGLWIWFVYFPLVAIVVGMCWFSGRMRAGAVLGTLALLWIIPLINIYIFLYLQYPPLRRALADPNFDRVLAGKEFLFLKGAWQYADMDWFIRVGAGSSAALCAQWIDFEKPVRCFTRVEAISGGPKGGHHWFASPLLQFKCRDGSEIVARLDCSPDVVKWVNSHGGRIHGIDEFEMWEDSHA